MTKTYKIVDATINHPSKGEIVKKNIEYYIDGVLQSVEFYSKDSVVGNEIKDGFKLDGEIEKDIIDNLTDEQLIKLSERLTPYL